MSEVVARGVKGRGTWRKRSWQQLSASPGQFRPLYPLSLSLREKIETIARCVYGADGVDYSEEAAMGLDLAPRAGCLSTRVHRQDAVFVLDDPKRLDRRAASGCA